LRVEKKLDISTPTTNKFVKNTTNLYKQKEKHKAQGKIEKKKQEKKRKGTTATDDENTHG
jgi:hypothetical protein